MKKLIEVAFITDEAKEMMDNHTFGRILCDLSLKCKKSCSWEHDNRRHGYSLFVCDEGVQL